MFGVSVAFGERSSATAAAGLSGGEYGQVQVQQSITEPGQFGYQVEASNQAPASAYGIATYDTHYGQISGEVFQSGSNRLYQASAVGSISLIDGGLFATNQVNDSFAVVDTGMPGVEVYDENRLIGKTDAGGQVVIPDLTSYVSNKISINPLDVPIAATIPFTERDVAPGYRDGVVVGFPIKIESYVLLSIEQGGSSIPVGSIVSIGGGTRQYPVGYDGDAYVRASKPGTTKVKVQLPSGQVCHAVFDYKENLSSQEKIGPIQCASH